MDWKKIAPWNWFREESEASSRVPVSTSNADPFLARSDIESLFERLIGRAPTAMSEPLRPKMDISEGRKDYTVRAELPGVEIEDVSIRVVGTTVILQAEKKQEQQSDEEGYHCVERTYGAVRRTLSLPEDADPEGIDASFKNGILTLRIPKHPARVAQERRVDVLPG
jgi:HSP20 family protein